MPDKESLVMSFIIMWVIWCYRNYFVFRGSQGAIELKLGEVHRTLAMLKRITGGSGVVDFGRGSAGKGGSKEGSKVVVRDVRVDEGEVRKLVVAWCAERVVLGLCGALKVFASSIGPYGGSFGNLSCSDLGS